MDTGISRYSNVFFLLTGILLVSLLTCSPAHASLNLANTKLLKDAAPGSAISFPITMSTDASDAPMDVQVDVLGFGQGLDMGYTPLAPAQDTSPYSARPFITLDKSSVHISPGSSETVTAGISLPANAGSGGRYALLSVHPVSQVQAVQTAFTIPIMITITGQPVTETGSILEISSGGSYSILTTFTNTGNHHYYSTVNSVTVKDTSGRTIADVAGSPTPFAIIPGATVQYQTMLNKLVPAGSYTVVSKLALPGGALLAERTATVTFAEPIQSAVAVPAQTYAASPQTEVTGPSGAGSLAQIFYFRAGHLQLAQRLQRMSLQQAARVPGLLPGRLVQQPRGHLQYRMRRVP